ncbi:MAG: metal-dependent hydrolase [Sulfurovaceae bacterium]|nr:metal-dependent hydrolase [Sulfurovaceae bacterium]
MPTIISHVAVPLAAGVGLGRDVISRRLIFVGFIASIMPDFDVVAFRLGIAYSDQLGHRGFTHSILFAIILGIFAALFYSKLKTKPLVAFIFVFIATISHGLLDMLTNGGLGIAFFWPFTEQRFFFPKQFIQVSPLSLHRLFSPAGLAVVKSELLWVWFPALSIMLFFIIIRKIKNN